MVRYKRENFRFHSAVDVVPFFKYFVFIDCENNQFLSKLQMLQITFGSSDKISMKNNFDVILAFLSNCNNGQFPVR